MLKIRTLDGRLVHRIVDARNHTICLYDEATGLFEVKRKDTITSFRLNADDTLEVTHTKASAHK